MNCWICEKVAATESHHVYPIHLGGPKDGIQIPLCGNCHAYVHQTATKLYKGQALAGNLEKWYNGIERAKRAANLIVQASINAEDKDIGDPLVPVTFKIPKSLRDKLHVKKLDSGFTNLNTYMIHLLVKAAGGNANDHKKVMEAIKEG